MTGEPQCRASQAADLDLAAALDALIPGGGGWPSATTCLSPRALLASLSADDRDWFLALAKGAPDDWRETWSLAESRDREGFQRFLAILYDAYYRAEGVDRRLREIAETGPREPCRTFDPSLLHPQRRTEIP